MFKILPIIVLFHNYLSGFVTDKSLVLDQFMNYIRLHSTLVIDHVHVFNGIVAACDIYSPFKDYIDSWIY